MKNAPDADFLIFDLGNVIIDIDYQKALDLIKSLVPESLHSRVDGFYATDFHKDYEIGKIDSPTFRNAVREYFEQDWQDTQVDEVWNSLLGNLPKERLDLVKRLGETYQTGILSNTNAIHIDAVYQLLHKNHGISQFEPIFQHVFYSHTLGLAKPSREIYEKLVEKLDTRPERIIFFDDLEANILGARSVGIQAVHVTGPHVLRDFFAHV